MDKSVFTALAIAMILSGLIVYGLCFPQSFVAYAMEAVFEFFN